MAAVREKWQQIGIEEIFMGVGQFVSQNDYISTAIDHCGITDLDPLILKV